MSRNLPAPIVAATAAPTVNPIILVEASFASGYLRLHSGYGQLAFNGQTFEGAGHLGKISQIEEGTDLAAAGVTFSLSGIPSAYIATFLGDQYQGRPIRAWLALIDSSGAVSTVVNSYEFFTGRMDYSQIEDGPETATISIQAESELSDLRRSRERRFTHEDRRRLYPNETGFKHVTAMQQKTILWGKIYKAGESPGTGTGGPPSYTLPGHTMF